MCVRRRRIRMMRQSNRQLFSASSSWIVWGSGTELGGLVTRDGHTSMEYGLSVPFLLVLFINLNSVWIDDRLKDQA